MLLAKGLVALGYETQKWHCGFNRVHLEFESKAHARIWMRQNQAGRRNLADAWRVELALGDKADLAEIGRAKQSAAGGDKVSEQAATAFIKNDNTAPKHNTQKEIAKNSGVSSPRGRSRTHLTVEHHKDHCLIHLELDV